MKILTLIRHAQAVDKTTVVSDHDRPLTSKGIKQSKKIPKLLKKIDIESDYLISSTAVRCEQTAKQLAKKFDLKLHTDTHLYFEGMTSYIKAITQITDDKRSLTIVGHNDDLTQLIRHLLNCNFPSVSKGSATVIEFNIESWMQIDKVEGELLYYVTS